MRAPDPLAREALAGLAGAGASQRAYLGYLVVQAIVVVLWWPRGGIDEALQDGRGPDTLLAALVACGATMAYYAARAGAEELVLPGQHTLREWLHATSLTPWRIVRGYVAGHALQTLHALALSTPVLLTAFTVSGGRWPVLGWSLAAIALQATCYRLAAAATYLALGHRDELAFWAVRAELVAGYVATALWLPAASHPILTARLVRDDPGTIGADALGALLVFVLVHTLAIAALAATLHAQLRRERRASATTGDEH